MYTRIVLQHVPPDLSRRYVPEFVRVLRPGGLAVFHVPSGPVSGSGSQIILPDSAYRAGLRLVSPPHTARAGEPIELRARVRNEGDQTWPAANARIWFHVGNHWRGWRGKTEVMDDGRAMLPGDVAPGEEFEVRMEAKAPPHPGPHLLEIDLVHEGVTWFADRGARVARSPFLVLPGRGGGKPEPPSRPFGMYSLPREEVLELVAAAGGRLVATDESDTDDFHDVLYHVTRP